MKLKAIVATCALAFAGNAAALTPSTAPDVTLFISGSSALQIMIGQVTKSLFVNGTTAADRTDVFYDGTTAAATGKNYRGYFGVGAATLPATLAGKKILVLETALGGSIQGVNPVALSQTVGALTPSSCVMPTTALVDAATGISVYSCTGVQNIVPDAGVSDLDPATNDATVNLPPGYSALTSAQLAALNVQTLMGVVMGTPVTSNLPASLQSLSKGQIAGLMGGTVTDWSMLAPDATTAAAVAGKSVIVCRRGAGSGTQSVINASIFGNPCMSSPLYPSTYGATTAPLASTVPVAAGNIVVIENSSSGAVKTCLSTAKNGNAAGKAINVTSGAIVNAGTANSVVLPAGGYAIGVLGTDQGATADYVFAAINGSAATVANAAIGAYDVVGEATFIDRNDLTGAKSDLFTAFKTNAGDPATLGVSGVGGTPVPGVLALSENGWAASTPFNPANPVMRVGNWGNMCQPFQTLQ